jgi:hypothetical protein
MSNEPSPDRGICEPAAADGVQPLPPGVVPGAAISVRGDDWIVAAIRKHDG